jgi:hypothetical protein
MPATIRASWYGGAASEPAGVTIETGFKFSRDDNQNSGGTPIPKPTATGTNYSFIKYAALECTGALAGNNINNRRIWLSAAPVTGLYLFFKDQPTYTQPNSTQGTAAGNYPADTTASNGAVPTGYTALTATTIGASHLWDNTTTSVGTTGRKGDFVQQVLGVGNDYAGGGGPAIALPDIKYSYDEF